MKTLQVQTKTPEQHIMLLTLLFANGYKYHECSTVQSAVAKYKFAKYPFINIPKSSKEISGCGHGNGKDINFLDNITAIVEHVTDIISPIIIEGVGDYSATVTPDAIFVGCQTISLEKFQELADAVAKMKV